MEKLNGLDLFSGIGGKALGLAPWVRTVGYCERDEYAQGVLLSRMRTGELDKAPIWDDVQTLHGENFSSRIDLISAGFPCQDASIAGTRNGRAGLEGKRTGLFFDVVRLADELRPRILFLENVPGIVKWIPEIRGAIREIGYEYVDGMLSAAQVGGDHARDRWFALAYNPRLGVEGLRTTWVKESYPLDRPQVSDSRGLGFWKAEPDLRRVPHGVPNWMDRLRCLGNAVVPLQARSAFAQLLERARRCELSYRTS